MVAGCGGGSTRTVLVSLVLAEGAPRPQHLLHGLVGMGRNLMPEDWIAGYRTLAPEEIAALAAGQTAK